MFFLKMMYLHCKELKKEEQNKFKVGKWKEIIKIRIETNEIENIKTTEKNKQLIILKDQQNQQILS